MSFLVRTTYLSLDGVCAQSAYQRDLCEVEGRPTGREGLAISLVLIRVNYVGDPPLGSGL